MKTKFLNVRSRFGALAVVYRSVCDSKLMKSMALHLTLFIKLSLWSVLG